MKKATVNAYTERYKDTHEYVSSVFLCVAERARSRNGNFAY